MKDIPVLQLLENLSVGSKLTMTPYKNAINSLADIIKMLDKGVITCPENVRETLEAVFEIKDWGYDSNRTVTVYTTNTFDVEAILEFVRVLASHLASLEVAYPAILYLDLTDGLVKVARKDSQIAEVIVSGENPDLRHVQLDDEYSDAAEKTAELMNTESLNWIVCYKDLEIAMILWYLDKDGPKLVPLVGYDHTEWKSVYNGTRQIFSFDEAKDLVAKFRARVQELQNQ